MNARTVTVRNGTGLHARPAGMFVETAKRFRSAVKVIKEGREADGRSPLSLMLLQVTPGVELTIRAEGPDETEAVDALVALIESRFGEQGPE